jgi:quinol monooxygenase YgiN
MFALRLLARVPAEKRQEFLESITALSAKEGGLCRKLLLKDVTDETLYCWMGDWDSAEELEAFKNSDTFRAIRGAAQVLGILEEVSIVEIRSGFFGEESM